VAQAKSHNVQNYDALLRAVSRQGSAPASRRMPKPFQFAFGALGETDEARFRASCVIGISRVPIRTAIDPEFTLDGLRTGCPTTRRRSAGVMHVSNRRRTHRPA